MAVFTLGSSAVSASFVAVKLVASAILIVTVGSFASERAKRKVEKGLNENKCVYWPLVSRPISRGGTEDVYQAVPMEFRAAWHACNVRKTIAYASVPMALIIVLVQEIVARLSINADIYSPVYF